MEITIKKVVLGILMSVVFVQIGQSQTASPKPKINNLLPQPGELPVEGLEKSKKKSKKRQKKNIKDSRWLKPEDLNQSPSPSPHKPTNGIINFHTECKDKFGKVYKGNEAGYEQCMQERKVEADKERSKKNAPE